MSVNGKIRLAPLTAEDLPELAACRNCPAEDLQPMLEASLAQSHDGCYYEQFALRTDGRLVGAVSLCARTDDVVSEGVEVFEPFRRNGFAAQGLSLLMDQARERGYSVMTAQVRTDNSASIALHEKLGFQRGENGLTAGAERFIPSANLCKEAACTTKCPCVQAPLRRSPTAAKSGNCACTTRSGG